MTHLANRQCSNQKQFLRKPWHHVTELCKEWNRSVENSHGGCMLIADQTNCRIKKFNLLASLLPSIFSALCLWPLWEQFRISASNMESPDEEDKVVSLFSNNPCVNRSKSNHKDGPSLIFVCLASSGVAIWWPKRGNSQRLTCKLESSTDHIKLLSVRKAMGNHLIKVYFLVIKLTSQSLVSAKLWIEDATWLSKPSFRGQILGHGEAMPTEQCLPFRRELTSSFLRVELQWAIGCNNIWAKGKPE